MRERGDRDDGLEDLEDTIECSKHLRKPIEYFCKSCSTSVCVKCIYDDHNGHHLMQVEEMSGSLLQNINDLEKMLNNTKRLIVENENLIEQVKEELSRLMDQQVKNINQGFNDLIRKLEEKKHEIILEFEKKFKKEEQKFISKQNQVRQDSEEIASIELILKELKQFTETNNDAQILQKIHDVTTFLHKSFTDLDIITKKQISQKSEIFIDPNFKPLSLNVKKALDIVKKFEMVLPSINQKVKSQESAMINSMTMNPLYGKNSIRSHNPAANMNEDDLSGGYKEEQIANSTGRDMNMMPISMSGRGVPNSSSRRGGKSIDQSIRKESMQKSKFDEYDDEDAQDTGVLTCFGDVNEILQYTLGRFTWEKLKYESNSAYTGSLKYMSCCTSTDSRIYLVGGVLVSNNHPSST